MGVIIHQYKPDLFEGNVLFFSHTVTMEEFPSNQDRHWRAIIKGELQVYLVPGNHISMMAEPHVEHIAHILINQLYTQKEFVE